MHTTLPLPTLTETVHTALCPWLCVKQAGNLKEIDLINAHGTSTPLNDKMETMAIKRLLGDHADKVLVQSTKSDGWTLTGAAGAVETIAALCWLWKRYCSSYDKPI